jgi:hypothetical protein
MPPRDLPILLGLLTAIGGLTAHNAATVLHRSQGLSSPATLASAPRLLSEADVASAAVVLVIGVGAVAAQALARRRATPPQERASRELARRSALVLALWVAVLLLSLGLMLRHPVESRLAFLAPAALLIGPARVYVRYRDGEASWVPWSMGYVLAVLALTRAPMYAGGCCWSRSSPTRTRSPRSARSEGRQPAAEGDALRARFR